ncbi:MAG: hypothetical protein V1866_02705 [archaeon]
MTKIISKMFGWLRKKIRMEQLDSGVASAFSRIREDLTSQRQFLHDLNENHDGFKRTTSLNHQRIADWITHFDGSIRRLESDLRLLEKRIQSDFDKVTTTSLNLFQEAYSKNIKDVETVKKEILKEVEVFLKENKHKQLQAPVINVNNVDNVNNVTPETSFEALSNPEKWLAGVLFNLEAPLSYTQITERTGKTINTVRVYMNQLKLKGFIDESTLPNGTKIFSLRHKAKVKKLYNL